MAARITTKKWSRVTGLDKVQKKLNNIAGAVEGDDILKVIMAGAKHVTDVMAQNVPVDTGNLQDSIFATYGKQGNRKKPSVLGGVNYANKRSGVNYAPYAHIIEFGTATRPPQAFIAPAVKSSREAYARILKSGFEKLIRETIKR